MPTRKHGAQRQHELHAKNGHHTMKVKRKDHHHNAKTGASAGGMPHNSVGSVGGSQSHTPTRPKAKGATTNEKGNRPVRPVAKPGRRAAVHKRGKFSTDTLI